jgi:hypothetical protein
VTFQQAYQRIAQHQRETGMTVARVYVSLDASADLASDAAGGTLPVEPPSEPDIHMFQDSPSRPIAITRLFRKSA